eukprot:15454630-Alexandrium_andersonii.AAC.1
MLGHATRRVAGRQGQKKERLCRCASCHLLLGPRRRAGDLKRQLVAQGCLAGMAQHSMLDIVIVNLGVA